MMANTVEATPMRPLISEAIAMCKERFNVRVTGPVSEQGDLRYLLRIVGYKEEAFAHLDHVERDPAHLLDVANDLAKIVEKARRERGAEVIKLVPRDNMPNADLVVMLERLVVQAKSGEIDGLAVACSWADGCTSYGWSTSPTVTRSIAAIARLQHAYMTEATG